MHGVKIIILEIINYLKMYEKSSSLLKKQNMYMFVNVIRINEMQILTETCSDYWMFGLCKLPCCE